MDYLRVITVSRMVAKVSGLKVQKRNSMGEQKFDAIITCIIPSNTILVEVTATGLKPRTT